MPRRLAGTAIILTRSKSRSIHQQRIAHPFRLLLLACLCLQILACGTHIPPRAKQVTAPSQAKKQVHWFEQLAFTTARQAATGNPKSAAINATKSVVKAGASSLLKDVPDWLKRIEVEADITEDSKPEFSLLTVQPLFQSKDYLNTLFTQGRVAYGRDGRTTLNIGLGYRRLLYSEGLMLGANTFFDYESPFDHRRVGVGVEVRSGPLELNVNYYEALSQKVQADGNALERALDGYGLEAGAQIPYLPWARLFAKQFFWDTVDLGKNIDGQRIGLRLRPFPFIEAEVGYTNDNVNPGAVFGHIRISFGLGRTERDSGVATIDDVPFRFSSMRELTLDKVRRENTIRVERSKPTATGGTVVVSRGT